MAFRTPDCTSKNTQKPLRGKMRREMRREVVFHLTACNDCRPILTPHVAHGCCVCEFGDVPRCSTQDRFRDTVTQRLCSTPGHQGAHGSLQQRRCSLCSRSLLRGSLQTASFRGLPYRTPGRETCTAAQKHLPPLSPSLLHGDYADAELGTPILEFF